MRFEDSRSLACEYQRRGWKSIGQFLILTEDSPREIGIVLDLMTEDGYPLDICIRDPYGYLSYLMREMQRRGSSADAQISVLDEALTMVLYCWEHQYLRKN